MEGVFLSTAGLQTGSQVLPSHQLRRVTTELAGVLTTSSVFSVSPTTSELGKKQGVDLNS